MTYIDNYSDPAHRRLRRRGVSELKELISDMVWLESMVYGTATHKGLGWLAKRKYSLEYRSRCSALNDDYLCLHIQCQHQIINDSYESALDYSRRSLADKLRNIR